MTTNLATQRRLRADRRSRRQRRAAFERLEDRRLLTWTFSITGSTATATSDGNADTLYIVQSGGNLYHSVDGTNFSPDWSGNGSNTTLAASTSSTINVDPTSGSNTHTIFLGDYRLSPAITNQAQINIVNGGSNVALTIDDSTDTSTASGTNAYTINNGAISTPLGISVNASGGDLGGGITLKGGTQADAYNVTGTRSGEPVTLTGGGGGNTFNVTGSSSPVDIGVGAGTNTVSVGGASGVGAQNVNGAITLSGSGATTVAVDDLLGTVTPETVNLTATQLTGLAPGTVDFGGLTNISTLAFGTTNLGGATIDVTGAPVVSSTVRIVSGSGGTNTINIGDATNAASGLPADQFQIVSTGSSNTLTVDDSADTGPATATVGASSLSFGVTQLPKFNYSSASLASLTLDGGSGGNTITVTGTPVLITTAIHSGTGVDNIDVQATGAGSTLILDTQGGVSADNVTLGGVAGIGAQSIQGTVDVGPTTGSIALTVDDSADTIARTVTLSDTALTGLDPATINLSTSVSALMVEGGSGGNTFTVTGTPGIADVTLDTGGGVDTVTVQGTGSGGLMTIDTQGGSSADNVTLGGVSGTGAQGLLMPITVQSTGGSVNLTVDDSQDGGDRSNVKLFAPQLSGLTPAAIDFSGLSGLTIDASSGTDSVVVYGTPAGATVTLTMSSSTTNAVSLGAPSFAARYLGSMTLNGTFGLTIDDSSDPFGGTITFEGADISFGNAPLPTFSYFGDYIETLTIDAPATAAETIDVAFSPYLAMGNQILLAMGSSTNNSVEVGTGGLGASRLNGVTVTGTTALTIDDTNSTGARTATITASSLDFGLPLPTFDYSGATLTGLTFDANAGGNTVNVTGSPLASSGRAPTTLNLGTATGNAVNLGDASNAANTLGNVTITGTTALTIDDMNDGTSGQTVYVDNHTLTIGATAPVVDYGGATISALTFDAGPNGTAVTVHRSPTSPTSTLSPMTLNMGSSASNTVKLGNSEADSLGNVTLNGAMGLTVDDSNGSGSWTIAVTGTTIGFSDGITSNTFDFTFAILSSLSLSTDNQGGNTVNVTGLPSLPMGSATSISTFANGSNPLVPNVINLGDGTHAASTLGNINLSPSGDGTTLLTIDDMFGVGNRTITVQSSGVDFGAGGSTFALSGGSYGGVTIDASNSGGTTVNVQSSPPALTGSAPLTLAMGTGTGNSVDFGNRADALGNTTVTTGTGGSTSILVDDSNGSGSWTYSVTSTAIGLTGGPTFTYGGASLTSLQLNLTNNGGNTVDVTSTPSLPAGAPLSISAFTGSGDAINLGDATHAASALGSVSIGSGSGAPLAVTIDDSAPATITVGADSVAFGALLLPTFDFTGATLGSLTIDGGPLGNAITVDVTRDSITTALNTGSGDDTIDVLATGVGGTLTIDAQGGANTVTLGGATGVGAQGLYGTIDVGSPGGSVDLTVDDSQDTAAQANVNLSSSQLSGLAPAAIQFSNLSALTVDGGSGGNAITITGTPAVIATAINSGSGVDMVAVQATGLLGTLNLDTQGGSVPDVVTLGGFTGVGAQGLQGTINVASTGGSYALTIDDVADATGRSITLSSTGLNSATIAGLAPAAVDVNPAEAVGITLDAGPGNSTLTVDCTAGNPLPTNLSFSGIGSNTLDLKGAGGNFTSETYQATGPGAGFILLGSSNRINFGNLTPINDTIPVGAFSFDAPTTATAFNVANGPTVNGFATTQIASPTNAFELINFANKTFAGATASNLATTISLNNPTPAAGLHALTITGGSGNDHVNVQAAPSGVATSINLGGGNDQASLTPAALPATGSLAFDGGTGTNTVTANAATTTANSGTAGTVGFGTGGSFAYQNVQTLDLTVLNSPPVLGTAGSLSATAGQALSNVVVATFTDPDSVETAAGYQATISWGDGTTSTGTVVADPNTPGTFDVIGSHTYATAGTPTTSVSLTDQGGTFPSTAGSTAVSTTLVPLATPVAGPAARVNVQSPPAPPPPSPSPSPTPPEDHVTGTVDDSAVTGPMTPDGFAVTQDNTPSFSGTATPGSIIQVFATGTFAGAPQVLIATTTADASGHWSATDTTAPLFDGAYMLTVSATPPAALTVGPAALVANPTAALGGLVVDTRGPVVDGLAFDRLHGLVYLTFQDGLSGLDRSTLLNPANYQVAATPISAAVRVPKSLVVTHVAITPPGAPTDPVGVVLTLNNGRLLRGGNYVFEVFAGGVQDVAGNALNGAFTGNFSTGGGLYAAAVSPIGSNFLAQVLTFHRKTLDPTPVVPTTRVTRVKTVHASANSSHSLSIAQAPSHLLDAALAAIASTHRTKHRPR